MDSGEVGLATGAAVDAGSVQVAAVAHTHSGEVGVEGQLEKG